MKKRGFTLIEAIVATAVFAFVMSSVIAIFIASMQIDRKTRNERAVVQNARYITDFLAKEIRNGSINYTNYPGGSADENQELHIINQAGEEETFSFVNGNLQLVKNGNTTNLNSDNVVINDLSFLVTPEVDPFTPDKNANSQPIVTLSLEIASTTGSDADRAVTNIQSSFAVRVYTSRSLVGPGGPVGLPCYSVLGSVATTTGPWDVDVAGSYAYVSNYTNSTFQIFDISDVTAPFLVSTLPLGSGVNSRLRSVVVNGNYVYVSNPSSNAGNDGVLHVVNVGDKTAPFVEGALVFPEDPATLVDYSIKGIYAVGSTIYTVGVANGNKIKIIDASTPSNPVVIGEGDASTGVRETDIFVSGQYAYVTSEIHNSFKIYDISNPANITTVSTTSTGAGSVPNGISLSGNYLYVALIGSDRVQIWNVADRANPLFISDIPATDPTFVNNIAGLTYFSSRGSDTIHKFNTLDPLNPVVIADVSVGDQPVGFDIQGDYMFISNFGSSTMDIVKISGAGPGC